MSAGQVRALLTRHGLVAHRDRGQNFLVDEALADRLAALSGAAQDEHVIEIGTGLGILTRALAARSSRVTTIEVDAGLVRLLREEGSLPAGVELIHADALEVDLVGLARSERAPARVVANLPYAVASPLLRRLLDLRGLARGWAVMTQREVATRLDAATGSRDYGSLAVLHRLCVRIERCLELPPRAFHPAPRVMSTFLRATPLEAPPLGAGELAGVERIVRAAFAHRRKTLVNSLRALPELPEPAVRAALAALGLDPRVRAEAVEPAAHLALARALLAAAGVRGE